MTVFAFIPARGGSTRVPRKNLAEVGGLSLVHRAHKAAVAAGCDRCVVSTDDREIADSMRGRERQELHARPADLAGAHAQIEPAIAHWIMRLETYGFACSELPYDETARVRVAPDPTDTIVMIQCTAPFVKPSTIRRVIEAAKASLSGCALTVTRFPKAYFAGQIFTGGPSNTGRQDVDQWSGQTWVDWPDERNLDERPRTQDLDGYVYENGCVYAFSVAHFLATGSRMHEFAVPVVIDWLEGLDIDDQRDLDAARLLAPMMDER